MDVTTIGPAYEPQEGQRLLEQARLSQQDFLSIMVAQLRNQNPLEPQKDGEFISQMAQFDQITALGELSESFAAFSRFAQLGQASALIGREIDVDLGDGQVLVGTVTGVELTSADPILMIGELPIPLSKVVAIREPAAAGV